MDTTLVGEKRMGTQARPAPRRDVRPLWVLHGGPQVDPLRRLLNADLRQPYIAVSTSCVDTMTADDVPAMHHLVNHADVFITERLPEGFRGLPIGLEDTIPQLRPGVPVVTFPRISYAGLHPFQIGHDPVSGLLDPPLVPYHDLRTVAVASGHRTPEQAWGRRLPGRLIREFAAWQLLRMRREEARTDVGVAGSVRAAGMDAVHTVDRPGNLLLVQIAKAIQECLDVDTLAADPGGPLFGQFRGPVDPIVAGALGLGVPTQNAWTVNGRSVDTADIRDAHLQWYRKHPDVLKAVLAAQAPRMDILGLL